MDAPQPGDRAPDFNLAGTDGDFHLAEQLEHGPVVLIFYQEAGTPACRAQLSAFHDDYDLARELGTFLVGISTDAGGSQATFAGDLELPFPLLSDQEGAVARAYGVYDDESRRARRAVFVIDSGGVVTLSIPWYNPANTAQFEQVFRALGLGSDG